MKIAKNGFLMLTAACLAASSAVAYTDSSYSQRDRPTRPIVEQDIRVNVNGNRVTFPDQNPTMIGNRVLVPLRGVFEDMGAEVSWDPETDIVTAVRNGKTITLKIGEARATIDDRNMNLDQPATVMNGRAMVPLRFLSESLGATVDWRATTMTVDIKTANQTSISWGDGAPGA